MAPRTRRGRTVLTLARRSRTVLALLAAFSLALGPATVAHADPSPAELEKQIDEQWNQLEPTIEQHNAVSEELKANQAKVAQLNEQIKPLEAQIDTAMERVGVLSAQAYRGGKATALNAILSTGSPTGLTEKLSLLEMVAKNEQAQVKDVKDLRDKLAEQRRPIDEMVAKLAAQEAELATKKKEIDAQITKLNQMRLAAYGEGGTGTLAPVPCPTTYPGGPNGVAIAFICKQIGKKYIWGTAGPNTYDCSGLAVAGWAKAGVSLPHNAAAQYRSVRHISRSELVPGDLVFYYSDIHHMAIYAGNGWVVHAPTTGDVVRMKRMDTGPIHGFGRPG